MSIIKVDYGEVDGGGGFLEAGSNGTGNSYTVASVVTYNNGNPSVVQNHTTGAAIAVKGEYLQFNLPSLTVTALKACKCLITNYDSATPTIKQVSAGETIVSSPSQVHNAVIVLDE